MHVWSVASPSCCLADLLVVAASSVLFAQAKAYCNLQNHARNRALCAFVSEINVLAAA
jgi:hypothetical protein